MVVAKGKFGGISTVNKQTITIFNLDNPVYQKLNAEVSETFKLEDIITKVSHHYLFMLELIHLHPLLDIGLTI